jgi:hypothetical protein
METLDSTTEKNSNKMIITFEGLEKRDKGDPPFCFVNSNSIVNWIIVTDLDEWRENTNERNQFDSQNKHLKLKK